MEPASLPFKFADCFRVASVRRNVLRASSSFKVGPSSNSFRLSSSLRTPNTSWPRIRVGSQAAQQSDPNSHLLEIERRSHSQSSMASLSRWTREENCWRHTWQLRPAFSVPTCLVVEISKQLPDFRKNHHSPKSKSPKNHHQFFFSF